MNGSNYPEDDPHVVESRLRDTIYVLSGMVVLLFGAVVILAFVR